MSAAEKCDTKMSDYGGSRRSSSMPGDRSGVIATPGSLQPRVSGATAPGRVGVVLQGEERGVAEGMSLVAGVWRTTARAGARGGMNTRACEGPKREGADVGLLRRRSRGSARGTTLPPSLARPARPTPRGGGPWETAAAAVHVTGTARGLSLGSESAPQRGRASPHGSRRSTDAAKAPRRCPFHPCGFCSPARRESRRRGHLQSRPCAPPR